MRSTIEANPFERCGVKCSSCTRGCATMFLAERVKLDVENRGNRLIAWIGALRKLVARYVPDHPPPGPHDRAGRWHRARRLTVAVVPVPQLCHSRREKRPSMTVATWLRQSRSPRSNYDDNRRAADAKAGELPVLHVPSGSEPLNTV